MNADIIQIRNILRQTPHLPGVQICQTGSIETIIRDGACGGFIKPSIIGVITAFVLSNHYDSPCRQYRMESIITLRCFWQCYIGIFCIYFAIIPYMIGYMFDVANNNPTENSIIWRNMFRILFSTTVMCTVLYSDYLFGQIMVAP